MRGRTSAAPVPVARSRKAREADPLSALDLRVGQIFGGKYRLDKVIGEGATSIVVAATNVSLQRRVALKLLLQPHREPRFKREALTAARLDSEYLVRVVDDGVDLGICYMVMDLLEGEDLRAVLRRKRRLASGDIATWLIQICEPLAAAHAIGVVHRDIKPENLFLTRNRHGEQIVKLLDFGHAKITLGDIQLTEAGDLIGTVPYMSPEQFQSPGTVDAQTDLWALGVVLYELLAGRRPFDMEGETDWQESDRIRSCEPISLRSRCPEVPADLEALASDLLQKEPAVRAARVRNVGAFASRLAPFAEPHAQAMVTHIQATAELQSSFLSPRPQRELLEAPFNSEAGDSWAEPGYNTTTTTKRVTVTKTGPGGDSSAEPGCDTTMSAPAGRSGARAEGDGARDGGDGNGTPLRGAAEERPPVVEERLSPPLPVAPRPRRFSPLRWVTLGVVTVCALGVGFSMEGAAPPPLSSTTNVPVSQPFLPMSNLPSASLEQPAPPDLAKEASAVLASPPSPPLPDKPKGVPRSPTTKPTPKEAPAPDQTAEALAPKRSPRESPPPLPTADASPTSTDGTRQRGASQPGVGKRNIGASPPSVGTSVAESGNEPETSGRVDREKTLELLRSRALKHQP